MTSAGKDIVGNDCIRCFLHICHLIITFFLEGINSEKVTSLREYIKVIRNSSALREALTEQCVQFGESAKGLKLDVMTRWNSTYLMIVRFTTMFRCLDELHWFNPLFKEVDRPKGEKDYYLFLVKLLKPFYDITMIAQKRKGTSIHLIPHWTHHLTELLQDMIATSAKSEEIYLSNLLLTECLNPERFGLYTRKANIALCAAALSPKFGSLPFGFVTQELREEVWEMMYQHSKELLFPESSSSGTSPDNNECPDQNLLDSSVLDANQFDQIRNCLRLIRTFWQRSFRLFFTSQDEQVLDPLLFWNRSEFSPKVSLLHPYIQAVLATPSSSSMSETFFLSLELSSQTLVQI